jgi:hypothetical protein
MQRLEDSTGIAGDAAQLIGTPSPTGIPSSISHARFGAMSARLAQVAASASANALAQPASAYDPMQMEIVLRFLSDVRRIADVVAAVAAGDLPLPARSGR